MSYTITVWENGQKEVIDVEKGKTLLDILNENDYNISSYCGGQGICGKCRIKLLTGNHEITKAEKNLLTDEELNNGIRLACMIEIRDDLEVEIENMEDIVIMTGGNYDKYEINQKFNRECIEISTPTLDDQRDYVRRILNELSLDKIRYSALKELDELNKEEKITVTSNNSEIITVEQGDKCKNNYGIAVDIGTTTIVLYLFNVNKGSEIDNYSLYNPQKKYGADVISRIDYSQKNEKGRENLQQELINGLNKGIKIISQNNDIDINDIFSMTVAGNTIMLHTLLGVSSASIAKAPYIPLFTKSMNINPQELNININPRGNIRLLPCVSGYVGADIVADLLTVNEYITDKNSNNLLIDIGTNGEIVLNKGEEVFSCATAAGPAFEGANISFGMAGTPGAISKFSFNNNPHYKTIGDKKAAGICGSGLVDIIAELYREGIINEQGGFVDEKEIDESYRRYMSKYKDMRAFRIVPGEKTKNGQDIYLTQKDVRELQLAKGAIQAGIEILKKETNTDSEGIDNVFIAGGFGNYIDPHNACMLNIIPHDLEEKIMQIGNAAGTGAKICLLNRKAMEITERLIEKITYIELSKRKDFQEEFMDSMLF